MVVSQLVTNAAVKEWIVKEIVVKVEVKIAARVKARAALDRRDDKIEAIIMKKDLHIGGLFLLNTVSRGERCYFANAARSLYFEV